MTKDYYNKNAQKFIDNTIDLDMSELYEKFEKYISNKAKVLDLGFGSGRDSLYFSKKGYIVVSTDYSEELVKSGKKILNNEVLLLDTLKMDFQNEFDAIWACSSLLHFNDEELQRALRNCFNALKPTGIMYTSFKKGNFHGIRNGRYFHDFEIEGVLNIVKEFDFEIIEWFISDDVRQDRIEKWINIIVRKP